MPIGKKRLTIGRYREPQTKGGIGTLGSDKEGTRSARNFFVVVAITIALMSFVVTSKFNAMVVSDFAMPKYAFCENPLIGNSQEDNYKTVSCNSWKDVSAAVEKLDGTYIILKRNNILVFSLDNSSSDKVRIIGNTLNARSCINAEPDYTGDMRYGMVTGICSKDSTLIDYLSDFVNVKEEIAQQFGFAPGTKMKTMLLSTFDVVEIDGIFDTKIIKIEDGKSKKIGLGDSIPTLSQDYGSKYLDVEVNASNSDICKGCLADESICIAVGNSRNMKYCDVDSVLKDKKAKGISCSNNYECARDLCNGKCVEPTILTNIGRWFKGIFG